MNLNPVADGATASCSSTCTLRDAITTAGSGDTIGSSAVGTTLLHGALGHLSTGKALEVHRIANGAPATVERVVTDLCGDWPTFVGVGAGAF